MLFDIGGTNTRVAVSKNLHALDRVAVFKTQQNFSKGLGDLAKAASKLSGGKKIKWVVGGVAGVLDDKKTKLVGARNLPEWVKKPLKKEVGRLFKVPVYLENDAVLAGLGEAHYGAGKDAEILAYLTISTGVGGARIVDGKIDRKTFGFEPGKQIIHQGKTLEWFISGRDVERRFGKKAENIIDRATKEELARYLAQGLNNIIVLWSPNAIVIGGSVVNIIPLDSVRRHLKKILKPFPKLPLLARARLGDTGGLWGALELLKQGSKIR